MPTSKSRFHFAPLLTTVLGCIGGLANLPVSNLR
jgi:hypothetical protein